MKIKKLIKKIGFGNFLLRLISLPFFLIAWVLKIFELSLLIAGEFISRGYYRQYIRELKKEFYL